MKYERESWVVDRNTGERRKVNKTHTHKTAPQGSSLSPALWRIFDGIFSRMYTNNLDILVENCAKVHDCHHVSYADDHLTIIVLKCKLD